MSATEDIKSRLDLVDIVSEHVQLRRSGRNYSGFCPFHTNTRTPSFYVFPETQTWHCFGACAEGGDVFSFMMKLQGWDFKEALEQLARRAGVTLEEASPQDKKRKAAAKKLGQLLESATDYFHQLLLHAPQAAGARQYIEGRALNEQTVGEFRLGFALDSWDACRTHFTDQGYAEDDLLRAGLLTEHPERKTRYDRFRNRLMIPIRDLDGQVVGFGARTLEKDGIPKYLNSPQTELFDKSRLLFGLDGAKRHIREARQAVIVEGYMDVMQGWQAGYRNMVAQMGTALTGEQLQLLKRYAKRFVLALDADAAGAAATMRSLQVVRETMDKDYEIRFDARGLVQHEGHLKADIRVVTLPEGNDPDNIIRADAGAWPKLLEQAKPVVAYVIDVATKDLDLNDAKAKAAAAQQVMPLISEVGSPVEQDHYRQQLALALRVDERSLRMMGVAKQPVNPSRARFIPPPPPPPMDGPDGNGAGAFVRPGPAAARVSPRERNLLRQCLTYPRLITQINGQLRRLHQPHVTGEDFSLPEDRALLLIINERARAANVATIEELCDSLEDVLAARVTSLLQEFPIPESELGRLADKLVMSVLDARVARANAQVRLLKALVSETAEAADATEHRLRIIELHTKIFKLNRAKDGMLSSGQRRAS